MAVIADAYGRTRPLGVIVSVREDNGSNDVIHRTPHLSHATAAVCLLGASALISCGPDDGTEPTEVDGNGAWMLTSESKTGLQHSGTSGYRLVATKLDTDVSVEILQERPSLCRGPTPDVVRVGWTSEGTVQTNLLRLTPDGFELEPDVLPPNLYGIRYPACPTLWESGRAIVAGTTTPVPAAGEPTDVGLYLTTVGAAGIPTAQRLDAGTGSVGYPALSPDLSQLFYAAQTAEVSELFGVTLEPEPQAPVLIDRLPGRIGMTASERWLVYTALELETGVRAIDLTSDDREVREFQVASSPGGPFSWSSWAGDDRLVLATKDDDVGISLVLFSAGPGDPQLSLLPTEDLRPTLESLIANTLDTTAFAFHRGVADTRTKGVASFDLGVSDPVAEVLFEFPADDPYSAVDSLLHQPGSNALLLSWTDGAALHHVTEFDAVSGDSVDLDPLVQGCGDGEFRISTLDEEWNQFVVVCELEGQMRAFSVDRADPGTRVWLDEFERDAAEQVRYSRPTARGTLPGIVTTTSLPDANGVLGFQTASVAFYSVDGMLRAQRGAQGWSAHSVGVMTLE